MLLHRKLKMWLPPGGHVDSNELPDDAAVREVLEETGIHIRLLGEHQLARTGNEPRLLTRPEGIQLENISPDHQHIDLIYFAVLEDEETPDVIDCDEVENAGWYRLSDLDRMGVNAEVRKWAETAAITIGQRLMRVEVG